MPRDQVRAPLGSGLPGPDIAELSLSRLEEEARVAGDGLCQFGQQAASQLGKLNRAVAGSREEKRSASPGVVLAKLVSMRPFVRLFAAVSLVLVLSPRTGLASATQLPGCPGYSRLLTAAAEALRRGDKKMALEKLREARAVLATCGDASSASGRATAAAEMFGARA